MATFDGERALEDVEKIHEQVLQAREERRRAEAAFEAFTASFRTQQPQTDSAETHSRHGAVRALAASNAPETVSEAPPAIVTPQPVRRAHGRALVFAGVAIAGAAAIFAVRRGQPGAEIATPKETPAATANAPQPPVNPPVPVAKPPALPAVPATGVNVELTTRRRVWMRVTLDGQRAFEREVPADQHIPLHANRSIVVRAGDAGAVAVRRNGRDAGLLGRDGVIATREFSTDPTARQ